MLTPFTWGQIIARFEYDFDGSIMRVVKFHPWKMSGFNICSGDVDETKTQYYCDELSEISDSLQGLLLSWLVFKNLGSNQSALICGLAKAIGIY